MTATTARNQEHQGTTAGTVTSAAVLAGTLGAAVACWAITVHQMDGMDLGVATRLGSFAFFASSWVAMMAAMMLPGAIPAVLRRAQTGNRPLAVPAFATAYLTTWALAGVAVYLLYRPHGNVAAGVVVLAAGLYDTSFVLVSRAASDKLERYRERMGWDVPWYSWGGGTYGVDLGLSPAVPQPNEYQDGEMFCLNGFFRDGPGVYRTYFTSWRGLEVIGPVWSILDRSHLGRQESWEDSPDGFPQTSPYEWWRRHDEYDRDN